MILGTLARVVAAEVARQTVGKVVKRAARGAVREVGRRASDPVARREAIDTAVRTADVAARTASRVGRRAAVTGAAVAAGIGSGIASRLAGEADGGADRGFDGRGGDRDADPRGARAGKQGGRGAGGASRSADGGDPDRRASGGVDDGTGDGIGMNDDTTHFGYRTVERGSKASLVGEVFDSVAPSYDVMNDLMSFGIHRLWKRFTIEQSGVRPGQSVLDIAGGTGDLAEKLARRVGSGGRVLLSDINASMLRTGRERLVDAGVIGNVHYAQSDAEALPFADDTFDCVTIAFGLRNVTDKPRALASMRRVLKPGGRLLVLEFSKPVLPLLARAYDAYSFTALPLMGKLVANDAESYRYLAESIRMHPDQETLAAMMEEAGFERVVHHNLTGGIVALHKGFKL